MTNVTYAIDQGTKLVWSRIGSELAIPILDYNEMLPENNYAMNYHLEKSSVFAVAYMWNELKWTKKIPKEIKNKHRIFWGLKPLN